MVIKRDMDGNPIRMIGTHSDISDRKILEIKLLAESQKNLSLLRNASDGIHILDLEGNVVEASQSFCNMLGYPLNEVIGMNVSQWEAMFEKSELTSVIRQQFEQHKYVQFETVHRRKDGTTFDVEISGGPQKVNGQNCMFYSARDITQRKLLEEQIQQLAYYDPLTKLPNRRLLSDRLSQVMPASRRSGVYGAIIFLDLDNFKPLNDIHGHSIGDLLLVEAAIRLKSCVREMDTVARFGGDEFVIMLSELDMDKNASISQANQVAVKILASLSATYKLNIKSNEGYADRIVEHQCTASIGVAVFINHENSMEDIIGCADAAMYQAKESGRNQIRVYEPNA
jgi:diguanylate cyclase (GGDEF)-like protein/PAS domain S-box-containing protein